MTSYCVVCMSNVEEDSLHNNTPDHVFNFTLYEWQHYRKALVKNRHGVILDINPLQPNVNFSCEERKGRHNATVTPEEFTSYRKQLEFSCIVRNIRNSEIFLTGAYLQHPYSYFSLSDPLRNIENGKILKLLPGSTYEVFVKFNSQNQVVIGNYKIPVAFNFQDGENFTFTIARSVIVSIEKEKIIDEKGKSPFTNASWPKRIGVRQPTQRQKYYERYIIPQRFFNCIKYGLEDVPGLAAQDYVLLGTLREWMNLNVENYAMHWHVLLWMEELAQELMLSRYNMENVKLQLSNNGGNIVELEVPGLAEKRPSVINNDMIDIKVHDNQQTCYRGIIRKVNDRNVEIAYLDKELIEAIESFPELEFDVRFVLSRLNLERMHQAIDYVILKNRVHSLFSIRSLSNQVSSNNITIDRFYNPQIETNEEQKKAVLNIIRNSSGDLPYIVFGPPGTGKTITIVEAILQMKDLNASKKILVCAPANAACDMIADRLLEYCNKEELIRVLSETVDISTIPSRVLHNYSNYNKDGRFEKIPADKLNKYNIVVTTLGLIGRYQEKYKPDVVFVDEAAQACEPEVNCAIGVSNGIQVILAGDPKQLGPMSSSRVAEKYGFGKSLLERLMDLDTYQDGHENYITMLKLNFRSHPLILQVPNELFYDNQLLAISDAALNDPISEILIYSVIQNVFDNSIEIKKGKAIEYCNVISEEQREGRSPSYFNVKEAETVLAYVKAFLKKLDHQVLQEDIGIVTPYIRQVYKIRELLKRNNFDRVEIGTTETFQGREKRVIIISTVRARQDLLLYDKKYNLGFVRNDKRFNVALTRAKSKLIVIGCAHVLASDTKWLKFMHLCAKNGVSCGASSSQRTEDIKKEIMKRLKKIKRTDGKDN